MKNTILITLVLILTSGCTSTGTIQGVSQGNSVQLDYEQDFLDNDGNLRINMPDDELYIGKFVQLSSSTSGNEFVIGGYKSYLDDAWILKDSNRVSSETRAQLLGNRGNTMECKFQLSDPSSGIDGGGIGNCQTSNGQKIAVAF